MELQSGQIRDMAAKLSKQEGKKVSEEEVINRYMKLQTKRKARTANPLLNRMDDIESNKSGGSDFINRLLEMKSVDTMFGNNSSNDDSGSIFSAKEMKEMLKMQLQLQMMKPLLNEMGGGQQQQPQSMTVEDYLKIEAMKDKGSETKDILEAMRQDQQSQREDTRRAEETRRKDLEALFATKGKDEAKERLERMEEKIAATKSSELDGLTDRFQTLEAAIYNLGQTEDPLSRQLENKIKEKVVAGVASVVGELDFQKKSPTTDDGRLDMDFVAKEGFGALNKIVEVMRMKQQQPPQPQPVQEMPPRDYAAEQTITPPPPPPIEPRYNEPIEDISIQESVPEVHISEPIMDSLDPAPVIAPIDDVPETLKRKLQNRETD
jgi:hypothetical protein